MRYARDFENVPGYDRGNRAGPPRGPRGRYDLGYRGRTGRTAEAPRQGGYDSAFYRGRGYDLGIRGGNYGRMAHGDYFSNRAGALRDSGPTGGTYYAGGYTARGDVRGPRDAGRGRGYDRGF